MRGGALPPPPQPFTPLVETIRPGTVWFRVHEPDFPDGSHNDGTIANPGLGKPTRFAFFGDPPVSVLYAADRPEGAVRESILHDVEPGEFVPGAHWRSKVLSAFEVARSFRVAAFHSGGLRRFGLYAKDLTDTDRTRYRDTVRWGGSAWAAGARGVSYMCRHFNTSRALCLFGDRISPGALRPLPGHPDSRAFGLPQDAEWLAAIAVSMDVVLRP